MNKMLSEQERINDHQEEVSDDLSWLEKDNPLEASVEKDPIDTVLDEVVSRNGHAKDEKDVNQRDHNGLREMTREDIEKCDMIVQQIEDAVRTFYKKTPSRHAEEAFWYEEVVENLGVVRKELIEYIKEKSLEKNGKNDAENGNGETDHPKEKMAAEQKKALVKILYSKEKVQKYAEAALAGVSAIEKFWHDESENIRSIEGVSDADGEHILRTLRQLIEQTYVRRAVKDVTEQIWEKYIQIDRDNNEKNEEFWQRVKHKIGASYVAVAEDVIALEIARVRADMESRFTKEREKGSDEIDKEKQNEKITVLEKEVDAARVMYLEKKKKQETAWKKIKKFFLNVDAREHADISFLREDYERAYQRYRSARVAQVLEDGASGDVRIFERMLDFSEARKRFDTETKMKAFDMGQGAMQIMKQTSEWLRVAPVAMKRGLITAFLTVGLVMGVSGTAGERVNNVSAMPTMHEAIQQQTFVGEGPVINIDVDAAVAESGRALGVEREERLVGNEENKKMYDNTGVEIVENSVRLTVGKKGESIESVIAQYLNKEHGDVLKKEKKTAGQAAHLIAQRYARDHADIDVNSVVLGTQIILDHAQKKVHEHTGDEQGVMAISDFKILEINPKKIIAQKEMIADKKRSSASMKKSNVVENDAMKQVQNSDNLAGDKKDVVKKGGVEDIGYVLEDAHAKKLIIAKTMELFGVMTGETVRDFRMRSVTSILSGAYEDKARQERVRHMIAQARIILGDHNMPQENSSMGLFMVRLYDKIVKLGHNEQDTLVLLRRVFDARA